MHCNNTITMRKMIVGLFLLSSLLGIHSWAEVQFPAPDPTVPPTPTPVRYWDYNVPVIDKDGKIIGSIQGWVDGLPDYNKPNHCTTTNTVKAGESIQAKINVASAGQYVCVGDGVWNINAQLMGKKGVHVIASPNNKPVIEPGYCQECSIRTNPGQDDYEFSGFEVRNGYAGLDFHSNNVVAKNNWAHHFWYGSSFVASSSYVLIEDNRLEDNGMNCVLGGINSNRHCHDVYLSNASGYCVQMKGNRVIDNYLGPTPGAGVNFNGDDCSKSGYYIDGTLVEGNQLVNVNTGIALWYGTRNTIIKNNSISIQNPPPSDMVNTLKAAITVWGGDPNEPAMSGNTYKLKSGYKEFKRYDNQIRSNSIYDHFLKHIEKLLK